MKYSRVAIIGAPGTGKTTLSNELSKLCNIQVTHLDGIHHLENWQIRDKNERDQIILDLIKKDKWIIEGTYRSTLKARIERADLIIWLDYSTFAQLKGILERYIKNKGKEKEEIPGCKEKMDWTFIKYVLQYNKIKRCFILENIEGIDVSKLLVFKNRKQLNKWLDNQKEN